MSPPEPETRDRSAPWKIAAAVAVVLVALLAVEVVLTAPTRGAIRTYNALLAAANSPEGPDLEAARRLCSARYRRTHRFLPAPEGGLVGLPRNIHKNFQVWRDGPNVRLCPTNRVGPVYQFVREGGEWKFDGPVGLLLPGGRVEPISEDMEM